MGLKIMKTKLEIAQNALVFINAEKTPPNQFHIYVALQSKKHKIIVFMYFLQGHCQIVTKRSTTQAATAVMVHIFDHCCKQKF